MTIQFINFQMAAFTVKHLTQTSAEISLSCFLGTGSCWWCI